MKFPPMKRPKSLLPKKRANKASRMRTKIQLMKRTNKPRTKRSNPKT